MTQIDQGWGAPASPRYEQLAAPFRPIFDDIRATAVTDEQSRTLPWEHLKRLRAAGFARLRLPPEWIKPAAAKLWTGRDPARTV